MLSRSLPLGSAMTGHNLTRHWMPSRPVPALAKTGRSTGPGTASADERGIALITAMLAIFISLIVIAGLFNVANGSITTTGQARKQQQAIDVASSGLTSVLAEVKNFVAVNGSLPSQAQLGWSVTPPPVGGTADPASIVAPVGAVASTNPLAIPPTSQLVYYASNPPTASTSLGTSPSAAAHSALLTVVGTSAPANVLGNQSEQELLSVGAGTTASMGDAIFGNAGLTFQNGSVSIGGPNPEMYTNDSTNSGALPCSNGINITGNVVVPTAPATGSTWSITNQCQITGNLYSAWPLSFSASSWLVSGTVYGTSTAVVNNSVNQRSGNLDIGGAGTFSGGSTQCSSVFSGTCTQNDPTVKATVSAMAQAFPELTWNGLAPTGWGSVSATSCPQALNDIQTYSNFPVTGSQGWIVSVTGCSDLDFNGAGSGFNGTSYALSNNLMILTTGSITFENPNGNQITGAHNLYYVVPYSVNGTATSCPAGSITVSGAPTFSGPTVAFYTPCNFTAQSSQLSLTGAIYAGGTASFLIAPALVETTVAMPLTNAAATGSTLSAVWQRQSS